MSELKKTIEQILTSLGVQDTKVYRYSDDFDALWQFDCLFEKVFVIWDETPLGEFERIATASYLTPLDWAVCAMVKNWDHTNTSPRDPLLVRIAVLDLNPRAHFTTPLCKHIYRLRPSAVPWLRLLEPGDLFAQGPDGQNAFEEFFGHRDIAARTQVLEKWKDSLASLRDQIRWHLTETRRSAVADRHAIVNIVGPYRLGAQPGTVSATNVSYAADSEVSKHPRGDGASHGAAMLKLFESVQLLRTTRTAAADPGWALNESRLGSEEATSSRPSEPLRILLLDDQWNVGWLEWLCSAFGEKAQFYVSSSPHWLLETLKGSLEALTKSASSDLRFKLALWPNDAGGSGSDEILFLDLRLFQGDYQEEVLFFKKLIALYRQFEGRKKIVFAWPPVGQEELNRLDKWCDNPDRSANQKDHFAALTLLPRLLSLMDFSYPIVIFSSTGQAEIYEHLKPYRNILTSFSKPRFFAGVEEGLAGRARAQLIQVVQTAQRILALRRKCSAIASGSVHTDAMGTNHGTYHAELYIDETGSEDAPALTLAGGYAVFCSDHDAQESADRFDDMLVRLGVRYFNSAGVGTQPPQGQIKPKNDRDQQRNDCHREIKDVLGQQYRPLSLGLVAITARGRGQRDFGWLTLYKRVLRDLIELFLFESLPAILGNVPPDKLTVSVYGATRSIPVQNDKDRKDLISRFGLRESKNRPGVLFYIDRDDIYQMLKDVEEAHGSRMHIHRALAIQLVYEDELANGTKVGYFRCRRCGQVVPVDAKDDKSPPFVTFTGTQMDPSLRLAQFKRINPLTTSAVISDYLTNVKEEAAFQTKEWLPLGDVVVYERLQNGGFKIVRRASEDDIAQSHRSRLHARDENGDSVCPDNGDWQPDYRALHYAVDQVARGGNIDAANYDFFFTTNSQGNFCDDYDADLQACVRTSRALDFGYTATALLLFPASVSSTTNLFDPSVRSLVGKRLAAKLQQLAGSDFFSAIDAARIASTTNQPLARSGGPVDF